MTLNTGVSDPENDSSSDLRRERGYGPDDVVVLMASNITPAKGQGDLVELCIQRGERWRNVRVVLAGAPVEGQPESRRYWEAVRRRADAGCRPGQVAFLGWRTDVTGIMAVCDIYVSTSYSEAMPDAVREAMALGKPVVATDVGGTGEAVAHGVCGFLYPPGDLRALGGYLDQLIASPELRTRLGRDGARIVRERFSTDAYARAFERMILSMPAALADPPDAG